MNELGYLPTPAVRDIEFSVKLLLSCCFQGVAKLIRLAKKWIEMGDTGKKANLTSEA